MARPNYRPRKCTICGKTYRPNSPKQKGCSLSCRKTIRAKNRKRYYRENAKAIYKRYKKYHRRKYSRQRAERLIAKEGLPKVCSKCQSEHMVEIHHKNFNPFDNSLENLLLLCRECHAAVHRAARDSGRIGPVSTYKPLT